LQIDFLNLILVLLIAWASGALINRLGYPSVLGELLAGIIFGPPLIGLLTTSDALSVLAEVGVFLLMLFIGMEINLRDLKKASKEGLLAALGGFIIPFVCGYWLGMVIGGTTGNSLFLGIALGVTSLATKSRILVDLKLLGTRIAHVMLVSAFLSDTIALLVFAGIIAYLETSSVNIVQLSLLFGKTVLFFGGATFVGLKILPFLGKQLKHLGLTQRSTSFTVVLLVGLVFAEMAELAGLHSILGAFFAGLFLREGVLEKKLSHDVSSLVNNLSLGFLAPIFFVTAGFNVSLSVFQNELFLLIVVLFVATLSKIVGTALFYLPSRNGWREGITIGAGMNGRGAVEIIIAQIGLSLGIISQTIFSIIVFMAFFTTLTVPILLKWGTEWLKRRNELVYSKEKRDGTIIIGATQLGIILAKKFAKFGKVFLIDTSEEHCEIAKKKGLNAICGNALDEDILSKADAENAQLLISLTSNAKVNVLSAQFGRTAYWIPNVYAHLNVSDKKISQKLLEEIQIENFVLGSIDINEFENLIQSGMLTEKEIKIEKNVDLQSFLRLPDIQDLLFVPIGLQRNDSFTLLSQMDLLEVGDIVFGYSPTVVKSIKEDEFSQLVKNSEVIIIKEVLDYGSFINLISEKFNQILGISVEDIRSQFTEREKIGSTMIIPGLAIPHIFIEGEEIFKMIIVKCEGEINMGYRDEKAYAVFALAGSDDMRNMHLKVLASIAQIVQNSNFEEDWKNTKNILGIKKFLLETDRI
jgi:Kef-type K+ transport system membrane component KefB/mannitol/fructose-specific phosphotransferase system IIA component (Ntr-type)